MPQQTSDPGSSFRFLDLPCELRDLVYCFYFGYIRRINASHNENSNGKASFLMSHSMPKQILHVSRTIRAEAFNILTEGLVLQYACMLRNTDPAIRTILSGPMYTKIQSLTLFIRKSSWTMDRHFLEGMAALKKLYLVLQIRLPALRGSPSTFGPRHLCVEAAYFWARNHRKRIEQREHDKVRLWLDSEQACGIREAVRGFLINDGRQVQLTVTTYIWNENQGSRAAFRVTAYRQPPARKWSFKHLQLEWIWDLDPRGFKGREIEAAIRKGWWQATDDI